MVRAVTTDLRPVMSRGALMAHLAGVVLLAVAVVAMFAQEPGLGDDLGYWATAHELATVPGGAIGAGFHDLRWPVWGVCWLWQKLGVPGLWAYYGEPAFYLAAGACLLFGAALRLAGSVRMAWATAILFVFHPLLDPAIVRPMPDLSEGFWCAAAVLAWWRLMGAGGRGASLAWAEAFVAELGVGFANRITGALIIPVLVILTGWLHPRRFGWLVLAGAVMLACLAVEAAVYHRLFGDWLHALNANLGARGRRGTENLPLWMLPFRFIDSLWSGNLVKVPYNLLLLAGVVLLLAPSRRALRWVPAWIVLYFLTFSCMLQSFDPPRPLVRDGERFIASLAYPGALLAAFGLRWVLERLAARFGAVNALLARPVAFGAAAVVVLALVSSRDFFNLGFVGPLRDYLVSRPAGVKVLTHPRMKQVLDLVGGDLTGSVGWRVDNELMELSGDAAAGVDEIWYNRKLLWTSPRKALERGTVTRQTPVFPPLVQPEPEWTVARVIAKDETPDLVFLRRAAAGEAPVRVTGGSAEAKALGLAFPASVEAGKSLASKRVEIGEFAVPAEWRGGRCQVNLRHRANDVQVLNVEAEVKGKESGTTTLRFVLYCYPETSDDFFCFELPADAERVRLRGMFSKRLQSYVLEGWTVGGAATAPAGRGK